MKGLPVLDDIQDKILAESSQGKYRSFHMITLKEKNINRWTGDSMEMTCNLVSARKSRSTGRNQPNYMSSSSQFIVCSHKDF